MLFVYLRMYVLMWVSTCCTMSEFIFSYIKAYLLFAARAKGVVGRFYRVLHHVYIYMYTSACKLDAKNIAEIVIL